MIFFFKKKALLWWELQTRDLFKHLSDGIVLEKWWKCRSQNKLHRAIRLMMNSPFQYLSASLNDFFQMVITLINLPATIFSLWQIFKTVFVSIFSLSLSLSFRPSHKHRKQKQKWLKTAMINSSSIKWLRKLVGSLGNHQNKFYIKNKQKIFRKRH